MMVDAQTYIKANAPHVAEWYIKHLIWDQQSFNEYYQRIDKHLRDYMYCDPQEFKKAVLKLLYKITSTREMQRFIEQRKEIWCVSQRTSTKNFLKKEWQTSLSLEEIVYMLSQSLGIV